VRLVIARCSVHYAGRLTAHLPLATRLLLVKADGSVLVHCDGGSYKPLNWMSPPCALIVEEPDDDAAAEGAVQVWTVQAAKSDDRLIVHVHEVLHDSSHELGVDPGLVKDGVEAHLQRLLAEQIHTLGDGWTLVRREYPTAIGPVDLLARDPAGVTISVEIKRRGEIEGTLSSRSSHGTATRTVTKARHIAIEVKRRATIESIEQLTRYLELLNRDPLLAPVSGCLAAQKIAPQARVLAEDRGIKCVVVDYDELRGVNSSAHRLF
jgi:endonuclease